MVYKDLNALFYNKFLKLIIPCFSLFILLAATNARAATVTLADYLVGGALGYTWTYQNLDGSQFTHTLTEVTSGTNAGRLRRGDATAGMVYDVVGNVLTWYEFYNTPITLPYSFPETIETGIQYPDNGLGADVVYLFAPSLTVPAGTFNDVLIQLWIDINYESNTVNDEFGLDPATYNGGVTDVNYYARGVGEIKYRGVNAFTGGSDGLGNELISTTPIPAAVWLFGSGLIALIGVARRRRS